MCEIAQGENGSICAGGGETGTAGGLHALAKTGARSTSAIGDQKPSADDDPENRRGHGVWNRRTQGAERRGLFGVPEIAEAVRGQADRRDQLGPGEDQIVTSDKRRVTSDVD